MLEELAALGMTTAAEAATYCGVARQGVLARKLSLATHLPDSAGVYLFRDADDRVLFIGRAKNLRTRVRSHFYAPSDLPTQHPGASTVRVDHVSCVSPLDALLLESRLLERYRPTYNRDQYRVRGPLYVHVSTHEAYPTVRVTRRRLRAGQLLGPVTNDWAARTVATALNRHFGLRQCTSDLSRAAERRCAVRGTGTCPEPCVTDVPATIYRPRVQAAVAVFNGNGPRFRAALQTLREQAASGERYEDAIGYRDAVRALDRTLSALDVAERSRKDPVTVVVEGDTTGATAIVLVHGAAFATLRFCRDDIASRAADGVLGRVVGRAVRRSQGPAASTPRTLRDTVIVDTYRHQHAPVTIAVNGDAAAAAGRVSAELRKIVRAPRKRHEVASAG
jgi:excinuclease UvrABC nuclease subunit